MTDQNEPRNEPRHGSHDDPVQPLPAPDAPAEAGTPVDPASGSAGRPDTGTRTRMRERVLGIRGIAAVGIAGLILGGLGGAAVGAALDGGDHRGPDGHGFVEQGRGPDQQGRPGPPPAGRPVLPPGTSPQQDDDQPSSSGDTTSGSDT